MTDVLWLASKMYPVKGKTWWADIGTLTHSQNGYDSLYLTVSLSLLLIQKSKETLKKKSYTDPCLFFWYPQFLEHQKYLILETFLGVPLGSFNSHEEISLLLEKNICKALCHASLVRELFKSNGGGLKFSQYLKFSLVGNPFAL